MPTAREWLSRAEQHVERARDVEHRLIEERELRIAEACLELYERRRVTAPGLD